MSAKDDVFVKPNVVIPAHELELTASRAGGPGGQHVNKTSSKIVLRWNVRETGVLSEAQKMRVLEKLASELTNDGEIIIHSSESRSQSANKKEALVRLGKKIAKALQVPKKRMKTKVSKAAKEKRLEEKKKHGQVKKLRSNKNW